MPAVRRASLADRNRTLATIADAFSVDPVVRWFLPDDATYPARATAPAHQGCGLGPTVAQPGIEAASAAGLPAFLETGVARNVALYERMGFVVTGVIDEPGLPTGWCMRRDP